MVNEDKIGSNIRKKELVDKYSPENYEPLTVILTKGKGIYVWDVAGKKYIDCLSGYSAINQGHMHPKIVKVVKKQLGKIAHTSRAFYNDKLGEFLEILHWVTGYPKIIPMNSGAEAVETAIKAVRKYAHVVKGIATPEIIVAENNFHGRTTTISSFSSDRAAYHGFGPFDGGFVKVPFNDSMAVYDVINENTAAILIEPVQGEAGVIIPYNSYLQELHAIAKRKDVLFVVDEIQTGLGRTGTMFAYQHSLLFWNKPDILILGKALSGGFYPISATCMHKDVAEVFGPGTTGSTFGGSPMASVIGKAALEVIVEEKLPENSAKMGRYLLDKLIVGLMTDENIILNLVEDIRGIGLLIAIEFYHNIAHDVCHRLAKAGVLVKDTHNKIIRLAPPLVITEKQTNELASRVVKTIKSLV